MRQASGGGPGCPLRPVATPCSQPEGPLVRPAGHLVALAPRPRHQALDLPRRPARPASSPRRKPRRSSSGWRRRTRVGPTRASTASSPHHGHRDRPWSVWAILKCHGIEVSPRRPGLSWAEFLVAQAKSLIACDFFSVENRAARRLYVLFFIHHDTRLVRIAGVTANPAADG
jgi:hypothetical protein